MKAVLFLALALTCAACQKPGWDCLESARPRTERIVVLEPFSRLHLSGNIDVELVGGTSTEITVQAGKAVQNSVHIAQEGALVRIEGRNTCDWVRKDERKPKVLVPCGQLNSLFIKSLGTVFTAPAFTHEIGRLDIEHEGTGDLCLNVKVDTLGVLQHELGNMCFSGKAGYLRFQNNNYPTFDGKALEAQVAEIYAAGLGPIYLNILDSLYADISGQSDVFYKNRPIKTDLLLRGSGRLKTW